MACVVASLRRRQNVASDCDEERTKEEGAHTGFNGTGVQLEDVEVTLAALLVPTDDVCGSLFVLAATTAHVEDGDSDS